MLKKLTDPFGFAAIDVLRFPLIILVVFIHVIPSEIHPVTLSLQADSLYTLISGLISHHLGRTAVPCFFLFSGYFFFLKIHVYDFKGYAAQLGKRCRTLLIPYLLWNVLFMLIILLKNSVFTRLGLAYDDFYASVQRSAYYSLWEGPLLFPLWYLRDLICMVMLSPLFYLLFKYARVWGLLLLALAYLLVWESGTPGFGSTAILFFGAGAFLGMEKYDLTDIVAGYRHYILLVAILLLGAATYFSAGAQYEYWIRAFVIFGVLSWIGLGNQIVQHAKLRKGLRDLSSSVFFIYAVHEIYIINWLKGGFSRLAFTDQGWGKLIAYFAIPVMCLLVCLALYRLFKTFLPAVLAALTGGRMYIQTAKK